MAASFVNRPFARTCVGRDDQGQATSLLAQIHRIGGVPWGRSHHFAAPESSRRGAVPVSSLAVPGTSGGAASAGRVPASRPSPATSPHRWSVLGEVVSAAVRLAQRPGVDASTYRDRLAAPAFSQPLATAEPPRHAWPSNDRPRRPRAHPHYVAGESRVGRATDGGGRRQVGIEATKSTVETYRIRPPKPPS